MKNVQKLFALLLVVCMLASLFVGCKNTPETPGSTEKPTPTDTKKPDDTTPPPETTEPKPDTPKNDTLVVATSALEQKFSTFFATTAYDMDIVNMTTGYLLTSDRGGNMITKGVNGETREFNGSEYTYYCMADCEVTENADGTVDYDLTMRDDIKFSDGTPATIDDVIFGIYVLADPTYDGSSTIYAMPIEGIDEYRNSLAQRSFLIATDAGIGYTDEEKEEYMTAYLAAGEKFAQEILDYCVEAGYNEESDPVEVTAATWGFDLAEGATVADFFTAIREAYGDVVLDMEAESAGSSLQDLIDEELGDRADFFKELVAVNAVDNIAGVIRTGDYSLRIHCTKFDATAIYNMGFAVPPLHYYGDPAQYDYENNKFGFPKGDLSIIREHTTEPLGCGPYVFKGYANSVCSLEANPYYFKGEPSIKNLKYQEAVDSDYIPGIIAGNFDIASPSLNETVVNSIKEANPNGELQGEVLNTELVDYRGYGYLGINGNLVSVGGDGTSQESKYLRLAIMTVMAICRDTVIASYYGDRASVIQYPISNTSWAAPRPTDEGYHNAYSNDINGDPIYTDDMSEEDKYEAAKNAAAAYLEAAGYVFGEDGKITEAPEGAKGLTTETAYEVMIPGQGEQDHPAYGIAVKAKEILGELGFQIDIQDVGTAVWSSQLNANTAEMWAAAWQSSSDPDMYQIYHSSNADGKGTNSNHYQIKDADLDEIILDARSSPDNTYRKAAYKEALEIILSWGVELPLYQRKDATVLSTERVKIDSLPADMTPYYSWPDEIEKLELN